MLEDTCAIDFAALRKKEKQRIRRERAFIKKEKENDCGKQHSKGASPLQTNDETTKLPSNEQEITSISCYNTETSSQIDMLSKHIVSTSNLKNCVHYIPNFVKPDFAKSVIDWLQDLPHTSNVYESEADYHGKWTRLKYAQRNVALFDLRNGSSESWLLSAFCQVLVDIGAFPEEKRPNHVLVNEYTGCEGILAHTDGPMYYPTTATISLGSEVLFQFTPRLSAKGTRSDVEHEHLLQVKLENFSLITFHGKAYTDCCHGINDRVGSCYETARSTCVNAKLGETVSRGKRTSLTFRHKYTDDNGEKLEVS